MSEEIDLNAYITSPYSSDLKKQRDAAFESARNIRKVTETPEEYRIRMAQQEMAHYEELRHENTDVLQQRLANIDISNIGTKNRAAIENMIREAESIKFFALYNHYDMNAIDFRNLDKAVKAAQIRLQSLKKGEDKRDIGTGIFADTYRKSSDNDSVLGKLTEGSTSQNREKTTFRPKLF